VNHVDTVELLKALADTTRLSLLRNLAAQNEPMMTCDIARSCSSLSQLSQPTMSHHINKLVAAGVVLEQKQAKQKAYRLNTELLRASGIDIIALTNDNEK
jgi:ArsR family transcriptional regulator